MKKIIVKFSLIPYGGKTFFMFDSEKWENKIMIPKEEAVKALVTLDYYLSSSAYSIESEVPMMELFNIIIEQKIQSINLDNLRIY